MVIASQWFLICDYLSSWITQHIERTHADTSVYIWNQYVYLFLLLILKVKVDISLDFQFASAIVWGK